MPNDLDAPADNAAIYLTVGEVVEDLRPINQGDVYSGITLFGFPEEHHDVVMLTTHPCSLRTGHELKARLQAAPVIRAKRIEPGQWATDHKRSMPLPDLRDGKFFAATLTESSIVTPAQFDDAERVAALSDDGVYLLQQRIVWGTARGAHHAVRRAPRTARTRTVDRPARSHAFPLRQMQYLRHCGGSTAIAS